MEMPVKAIVCIMIGSALLGGYIEHQFNKGSTVKDTITNNKDITTIIKEKKNKDGSSETDTTIVDRSKEKEQIVATAPGKAPDWFIQAGMGLDRGLTKVYMGSVSRRVLGPVYVGIWASSQQAAGVSLALQF